MTGEIAFQFVVANSAERSFNAITQAADWWGRNITGSTEVEGAVFEYRFGDMHRSKIRVTRLEPNALVSWHVLENEFSFLEGDDEWVGTDIVFVLAPEGDGTRINFTHKGLNPTCECYDVCFDGWTQALDQLKALIETGQPGAGEMAD